MDAPPSRHTGRHRAKENRRAALLDEAARLFALRGYNGVTLEELGAACGVSGPAVYRHFAGKAAVLGALLVDVSRGLLDGGRAAVEEVAAGGGGPGSTLRRLAGFHADFALANPDVIRVQDRDMASLAPADAAEVRRLQREYIGVWTAQLRLLHPAEDAARARFRAQAVFGLLNSTPHSTHRSSPDRSVLRSQLVAMAWAALSAPVP